MNIENVLSAANAVSAQATTVANNVQAVPASLPNTSLLNLLALESRCRELEQACAS
jgi:hypothetical protein